MNNFESKLRSYVQHAGHGQRQRLQAQLADRIAKVKQAAVQEVKRQAQAYSEKYRADHTVRERAMRAQYDKLMARIESVGRKQSCNVRAESWKVTCRPPPDSKGDWRIERCPYPVNR